MKMTLLFFKTVTIVVTLAIFSPMSYCQIGSNSTDENVGKIMELELNGSLTYVEGGTTIERGIVLVDPNSPPTYRGTVKHGNSIYIVSGIPNADSRKIRFEGRGRKVYLTVKIQEDNMAQYLSYRIN